MREPILKAVAMPPKLFWAPMLPAGVNLAIQFTFMSFGLALGINPLFFLVSIVFAHLFIVIYGAKEPHLSNMMKAYGPTARASVNMYKSKGNKLAP